MRILKQIQFDKQTVLDLIQQQTGSQHAEQAAQQLPDRVDHEHHADLLQQLGVHNLWSRSAGLTLACANRGAAFERASWAKA